MKSNLLIVTMLVMVVSSVRAAQTDGRNLSLLSGCWRGGFEQTVIEERWDRLEGGLMLGTAKTIVGNSVSEFEFLKIQSEAVRTLYTPYINGKQMATFTLNREESGDSKLVFENPDNEFPSQIIYSKIATKLNIQLIGKSKEQPSIQYSLNLTDCR